MLLMKTALAGLVLAILPSATLGAEHTQPSTPPAATPDALRTALDSARTNLQGQEALPAINALLKTLALAGAVVRVKRERDLTLVSMSIVLNSQLHVATCADKNCFQATVNCAAELLKAPEAPEPDSPKRP